MLAIDLKGKKVFIAGIADDRGFGWAIAKMLAQAGAKIVVGTWPLVYKIFTQSLAAGKFDASRQLPDGTLMEFEKIYPFDGLYDAPENVPENVRQSKRYKDYNDFTISGTAKLVHKEFGELDAVVHSLANAPEAQKPLLETSREGYLAGISASAYSLVSMAAHFGPFIKKGGSLLSLTYIASEKVIPGYGGGLNAAKAALESDTRVLALEAGRKWGVRVNTVSAGPLGSRAARAIGFIDQIIDYSIANAPLSKDLKAEEVGCAAAFLSSPLASAITGTTFYVDNGLHVMGIALDSASLQPSQEESRDASF